MTKQHKPSGGIFLAIDTVALAIEAAIYSGSFAGPAYLLWRLRHESVLFIVPATVAAWLLAAVGFVLTLVAAHRLLIGPVPFGRFFLSSRKASRWIIADRFVKMMIRSPFRHLVMENGMLRYLYLRGLGAQIDTTCMVGNGVKLPEPWALRLGQHVHLGDEAILSGHKVERGVVTLGTIEIGDEVLVGARCLIFPGVKIGSRAVVGASSVVTRGTVIPEGEVWAGNPAVKIESAGVTARPGAGSTTKHILRAI